MRTKQLIVIVDMIFGWLSFRGRLSRLLLIFTNLLLSTASIAVVYYSSQAYHSHRSPSTSTNHLRFHRTVMTLARLYIVRHGETDANRQGIMQGQLDTPLNPEGILQARQTADILEKVPFDYAFTSDLERARKVCDVCCLLFPFCPTACKPWSWDPVPTKSQVSGLDKDLCGFII
jgi:hypothetical protein